jgi:uncharacterized SAM-binding protein YcdF (DUF218 family)
MSLFFLVSKAFWFLLQPSHALAILALAAAALLISGRPRPAKRLCLWTAGLFVVFGILPTGPLLVQKLEAADPRPPLPQHIDGILTLGGGLDARTIRSRHALGEAPSESRLISTFELARRYPSARVVFSGGWGENADWIAARYIFAQMGLDPQRMVLERQSHNTYENLLFSQRLLHPGPGQTWILATSAFQAPRAMAVARRLKWILIPWPTDYLTPKGPPRFSDFFDFGRNFGLADLGVHEWLGIWVYELTGKA